MFHQKVAIPNHSGGPTRTFILSTGRKTEMGVKLAEYVDEKVSSNTEWLTLSQSEKYKVC